MTARGWLEEIDSDLLRISLRYPNGYVNSYLVLAPDGPRLIETGPPGPEGLTELELHLRELGVRVEDLKGILLTHGHMDHVGGAAEFARRSGVRPYLPKAELTPAGGFMDSMPGPEWLLDNGLPESAGVAATAPAVPQVLEFLDGDQRLEFGPLRLQVLAAPGHSPGLVCVLDQGRRTLFSSDHLLRTPTPVAVRKWGPRDPLAAYLGSLERLWAWRATVRRVLPGHGRSLTDLEPLLEQTSKAHQQWLDQMLGALDRRGATAFELALKVGWLHLDRPGRQWLGVARAGAYLAHLESQGLAVSGGTSPVRWYRSGSAIS